METNELKMFICFDIFLFASPGYITKPCISLCDCIRLKPILLKEKKQKQQQKQKKKEEKKGLVYA